MIMWFCHMILQDHVEWEQLKVSHPPTKFGGRRHFGHGNMKVLFYHVSLQDHVIKASCNFIGRLSLKVSHHPQSLLAIGIVVVEMFLVV